MSRWSLLTLLAALGNTLLYATVYREYLHPVYPMWFDIVSRGDGEFAFTLVATLLPLSLRSRLLTAASALALLTYVLYFVPGMWQLHYGLHRGGAEAMGLQAMLAGCMAMLFLASREWFRLTVRAPRLPSAALLAAIGAMILAIAWSYRSTMRLVGFDDVYELRFASVDAGASPLIGYLTMWCTYCFIPYCFARGLHARDLAALGVGVAGCVVIYMATGAKSAILAPLILGGLYVVLRSGRHAAGKLLLAMIGSGAFLLWMLPEGPLFDWARSVFFMRTMGSSGWTTQVYYEYFSTHGYTYYSHLGFVDHLTDDYAAYRPYILGQLIGIDVTGTEASNFNAGFWGSDGVAALGAAGLPIATFFVAVYFVLLNIAARGVERRFAALWACGFGVALLNLPLGTAMVSGGGLLMVLLLIFVKAPDRSANAPRGAARSFPGPKSSPPPAGAPRAAPLQPLRAPRSMTSKMPLPTRLADIWRWHLQRRLLPLFVRPDNTGIATVEVADTVLPASWIGPGWVCYCVGVGEDIVLDRHLTETWRAPVWAFDPTPRAIAYMKAAPHDRELLTFVPVGIWSEDCVQRFHAPANPQWVSHSITEDHGGTWFDAQCRAIPSVMRDLGHDRIDFIKLNIEGAEHVVLESMLAAGLAPAVITLTWEGKGAFGKALSWTRRLRARGYKLLAVRDWFFTYVRDEARPAAPNPAPRA